MMRIIMRILLIMLIFILSMGKIFYPNLSYKINGILFKVSNQLGKYCNEKQYADAIEEYLKSENIKYKRENKRKKILPQMFEEKKEEIK